jgi:hypothetical protein
MNMRHVRSPDPLLPTPPPPPITALLATGLSSLPNENPSLLAVWARTVHFLVLPPTSPLRKRESLGGGTARKRIRSSPTSTVAGMAPFGGDQTSHWGQGAAHGGLESGIKRAYVQTIYPLPNLAVLHVNGRSPKARINTYPYVCTNMHTYPQIYINPFLGSG